MNSKCIRYVLDGDGNPIPEPDLMKWAEWYENSWPARRVARTEYGDDKSVSTVFLGIDHGFGDEQLLYETMAFGFGEGEGEITLRYPSRDEALRGHETICRFVEALNKEQCDGATLD